MEPKVNYALVGAFVVLLGLTILGAILWLGKTDYRGIYDRYYVYTRESVAGLSVDSTVKYRGVDVGRVKEVILNPENAEEVRVTLDIVGGTPIKIDTQAVLVTQGLTGLVTLNLTGGSREAPPLTPVAGQGLSGHHERALVTRSTGWDAGEPLVGARTVDPRGQSERTGPQCVFCAG
jgi:phospholipid/cholesterol/gamma-HCH transport system substrate-binding protein